MSKQHLKLFQIHAISKDSQPKDLRPTVTMIFTGQPSLQLLVSYDGNQRIHLKMLSQLLISVLIFVSVCAFPYIMAFAEDLLEIRLVANGSLVHAACIPGLKLLCGRRVITYFII